MAGIGFELKKIYRKEGISYSLMGAMYSSVITIGPTVVVMATILILYLFLDLSSISMANRELLSSTILYVFIFSVTLTAPFNSVFSRYLADKFYQEEFDDILCSYYTGLLTVSTLAMIMGVPMLLSMYFRGSVPLPFVISSYVMWASVVLIFFSITYLHATKDYKIIALFFFIGMIIAVITAELFFWFTYWDKVYCILYGLTFGFFIIAFCIFSYIRFYFKTNGKNYTECLRYIWQYRRIFLTNLFYALGLYCHNFVFWTTPGRIIVANTFISHQAYDMATCLAMFSNISTMVIFTVMAETQFHETYQKYMEAVIGGTYKLIKKNKRIMFRTLVAQIAQVFVFQIAITCVCFLLLDIFGLQLGFSSMTMRIYPVLAAGYLGVFLMYCCIVYLYYFEDTMGSMLTGFLFALATLLGSIWATHLPVEFYGIGVVIGTMVGWTFVFFRLRSIERNFEAHIFCRYKVISTMKSSIKGRVVYSRSSES